jgi:hypothetical protein
MGGTDDPSNLILLSVEDHAKAHRLLFEQHGRWEDEIAWRGLSGLIGKEEVEKEVLRARIEKMVKTKKERNIKPWNKGKKGLQTAWNKGKSGVYSDDTLNKMKKPKRSKQNMGKYVRTEENKNKLRELNTGKSGILCGSYENIVLNMCHSEHGSFSGNRVDAIKKYDNLNLEGLRRLYKGKVKSFKGWKLT